MTGCGLGRRHIDGFGALRALALVGAAISRREERLAVDRGWWLLRRGRVGLRPPVLSARDVVGAVLAVGLGLVVRGVRAELAAR
jgi:hypothetical protein